MDKKAKKRVEILRERLQKLKKLLANEKLQPDDPAEITRIEADIAPVERELSSLLDTAKKQ